MVALFHSIRYSLRQLAADKFYVIASGITLAFGIGALLVVSSIFRTILLHPLPYDPDNRLVVLMSGNGLHPTSYPYFRELRDSDAGFEDLAVFATADKVLQFRGELEETRVAFVSASLFSVTTPRPVLGRVFLSSEDSAGAQPVALISTNLWLNKFGGNSSVLGESLIIGDTAHSVIGVLPNSFSFPAESVDVWAPFSIEYAPVINSPSAWHAQVAGRLKPAAGIDQTADNVNSVIERIMPQNERARIAGTISLMSYREYMVGRIRPTMLVLLGACLFVFATTIANVVSLALARRERSRTQAAIKTALGAGRREQLLSSLADASVLCFMGGAAGTLAAIATTKYVTALGQQQIPRLSEVAIGKTDIGIVLIATAIAIAAVHSATFLRRIQYSDIMGNLRTSTSGASSAQHRFRRFLVAAQCALAVVLMIGSVLMIRSFIRLIDGSISFNPTNVITFRITNSNRAVKSNLIFSRVEERVAAMPGVKAEGMTTYLPLTGRGLGWYMDSEEMFKTRPRRLAGLYAVSPGYFRAIELPLKMGRDFSDNDTADSERVVIIDERLAQQLWPNQDAVGRKIKSGGGYTIGNPTPSPIKTSTVVGVVSNVRKYPLRSNVPLQQQSNGVIFQPMSQPLVNYSAAFLAVRTDANKDMMNAIRKEVTAFDKTLVVSQGDTMENLSNRFSAETRFYMIILNVFGIVALILGAIGIYAVTAYWVAQHTREFGIRLALGSRIPAILKLILMAGMKWAIGGIFAGVGLAIALSGFLESVLFEVSGRDPGTFIAVALGLILVAFVACYIPARRALKLDPAVILRQN